MANVSGPPGPPDLPPPPGWTGPPPNDLHPPPSGQRWVVALAAFGLACALPSLFFVAAAFSDDQTASRTAGGTALLLIGVEVVVGFAVGVVAWAVAGSHNPSTRRVMTTLVLLAAAASGLVTGFLGGVVIAMERHPTWDDA